MAEAMQSSAADEYRFAELANPNINAPPNKLPVTGNANLARLALL